MKETFESAKVYLPQNMHRQIRIIAAAEGVSQSRVMATILRAFFRGIPVRFEDETAALTDAFHRAEKVKQAHPSPGPVKEPLSRVKIGDRDPAAGYATSSGLSSQPEPMEEENGPTLTDLTARRNRLRRR